jgi:uncharacterized protein
MIPEKLSSDERIFLLDLARKTIEKAVANQPWPELDLPGLSQILREKGASFVTLTEFGDLRGCIGALEAYQPLAEDVREHAAAAALEDFRFPPVTKTDVPNLQIEISRLTIPYAINYDQPEKLAGLLKPGQDGVILRDGYRRATFLPQVWEKIPDPEDFLANLCQKMGVSPDLWRRKILQVSIYHVEEFHEE